MELSLKFSDVHGENVTLSHEKNSVSWKHHYSGGILFSAIPIEIGKPVKLECQGTSKVHVGYYEGNPADIEDVKDVYLRKKINYIGELDIYKKKCSAYVERADDSFTYTCSSVPYKKTIVPGTDVWVAIYIQFGTVRVKMRWVNQYMAFHSNHGENILFTDITRTMAMLENPNPAATACIELNPTEDRAVGVALRLKPYMSDLKKYGLKLSACPSSAKLLRATHAYLFSTTDTIVRQQKCTPIQKFERKSGKNTSCDGDLTIIVENGGKVKYVHSNEITGVAHIAEKLHSDGITLVLDIARISVDITDAFESKISNDSDDEECSSRSSVNSTSVVSKCLDRSLNSPTVSPRNVWSPYQQLVLTEKPLHIAEHDTALSPSDTCTTGKEFSFKQPMAEDCTVPKGTQNTERLCAWVQASTNYTTSTSKSESNALQYTRMREVATTREDANCETDTSVFQPRISTPIGHGGMYLIQGPCTEDTVGAGNVFRPIPGQIRRHHQYRVHFQLGDDEKDQNAVVQESPASMEDKRINHIKVMKLISLPQSRHIDQYGTGTNASENATCNQASKREVNSKNSPQYNVEKHINSPHTATVANTSHSHSPRNQTTTDSYRQISPHTDIADIKDKEMSSTGAPPSRLALKRSSIGIRVATTVVNTKASNEREHNDARPHHLRLHHQATYPDLMSAKDNSELFHDDYNVELKKKARSTHMLKNSIKENIKDNYTELLEKLVATTLIDHLYECDILDEDEYDDINNKMQTRNKRETNKALLGVLRQKPVDRAKFISALGNAHQGHLVSLFEPQN